MNKAVLAAALALTCGAAFPAAAQQASITQAIAGTRLDVSATGEVSRVPDVASVSAGAFPSGGESRSVAPSDGAAWKATLGALTSEAGMICPRSAGRVSPSRSGVGVALPAASRSTAGDFRAGASAAT